MFSLETLRLALLILHFLGLAALIGPALVRHRMSQAAVPVMIAGAAVQLLTGNGLIAANQFRGSGVIEAKMITKLALVLIALVLLVIAAVRLRRANRSGAGIETRSLERVAAGCGVAAAVLAVAWT